MKKIVVLSLLCSTSLFFSQKKASESLEFLGDKIEINTQGIDNVTVENTDGKLIEIFLFDVSANLHDIYTEQNNGVLTLNFENKIIIDAEDVFRKFITKRVERASILVKIPKAKTISIFGQTVGIQSKSYQGNLNIYIDKGNIYLNNVYGNTEIKLFAGNIKANLYHQNILITSNKGNIKVNNKEFKKLYTSITNKPYNFEVNSINANVELTTINTQ